MVTSYKFEGKTKEDVIKKIETDLNVRESDFFYAEEVIVSGLFKNKKISLEVVTKESIVNYCKGFFKDLSGLIENEINYEINFDDEILKIMIVSENNNRLIGKSGKNLEALTTILRSSLSIFKYKFKIDLDIGSYKHKKNKRLEKEIKNICKEVLITKSEVKLDPMNSYERRIVHTIVSKFENVESTSYGENKERYTIIKYVD